MARSPRVWLVDIRDEIAGIRGLLESADFETFAANWGMKRAVEHALSLLQKPQRICR